MGELSSALDALAADDLHAMFGPYLLERLRELLVLQNRIAAEVIRTVRECELTQAAESDGLKTMPSWLRGHAHLSSGAAGQLVRSGRALEHLPAVAAAFAAGAVTAGQVEVIAKAVTPENRARADAQGVDLGPFDEDWAIIATEQPHDVLATAVQLFQAALDPDGPEPDPTEGRSLTLSRHADGTLGLRGQLDAVGGEKLAAALGAIVQADRPQGDTRTRAQQQADALVQLADNQLASGSLPFLRTVKPHVIVTIPVEDLMDPASGPGAARTGFGVTLSAARARWIACDAQVTRIVLDPDGLPLDVGRTKRVVPAHIRRAVEVRDRHCVFAGCHAPSHWCDVHRGHSQGPAASVRVVGREWSFRTPRCTTASGFNGMTPHHPVADGAPTAPTAPRSSSARFCASDHPAPAAACARPHDGKPRVAEEGCNRPSTSKFDVRGPVG